MIVIADTSPINYLILIGEVEVLPARYGRVLVSPAVCNELQRVRASELVRTWIAQPLTWLEVRAPSRPPDAQLAHLDAGERDAILLAEELRANQLSIDEIVGGGRRSAGSFPPPAPWASWSQPPRTGCWT
jgi:predicted nucleic acid-binding protein